MPTIWEKVERLEGTTLHTLSQQKPFKIVEVMRQLVRVIPQQGKGKRRTRPIRRDRIERIADMGVQRAELRQRVQQEYPESWDTSYLAAIVHEIGKT